MIDFKKYSNPEIVGHIAAVMASPQRAPMRIFKYGAIFALIGVAIGGLFVSFSERAIFAAIVLSVFVFCLLLFSGILFGAYSFLRELNNSFQSILEYTNQVVHLVAKDIGCSFESFKSGWEESRIKLPSGNEIFSGVFQEVVNPAVVQSLGKISFLGKLVVKAYTHIVNVLLKISSAFFCKLDKEMDKVVNEKLDKAKKVGELPLDFAESTALKIWQPRILNGSDKYIGKAKGYIRRIYFWLSLPTLALASLSILAAVILVIHG